ncbi:MAG: OFA family MFS transporter [Chloroflexota bacterium]|nr:OFA family MFS transporter [Chloroflexota bacterium]
MSHKAKTGIFYGWIIVAIGSTILALEWGFQYSYGIFFTELCQNLNWTRAMVSGGYSLFMLWHSISYLISGRLNDKYGPRLTLAISIIALTAGYALMSTIKAPWQLYIFYGIMLGTGAGFGYVPIASTVSRWFVAKRGMALGITTAGIGIGTLALAPFAQFLISQFAWRASYLIIAAILLVIGLPISQMMRLEPSAKGLLPDGVEEIVKEDKHDSSSPAVDFTLTQATKTKAFWTLFAMYASLNFAIQLIMVHLKAYATDMGITPMIAATVVGLVGGISILGRMAMGSVSDKIGRRAGFFIGYLSMAVIMLWLLKATQAWQFYLFSSIFGFGYGSCMVLFPAIIADWFGIKFHGTIFGVLSLAPGIGGAIGPLIAGYTFDATQSYDTVIVIGAVILFIAVACSFIIKAPLQKTPP